MRGLQTSSSELVDQLGEKAKSAKSKEDSQIKTISDKGTTYDDKIKELECEI